MAAVVIRACSADDAATVPVAMTGGVFRHAPLVRQVFYNELAAMKPSGELNLEVVDPVEGALRMARRAASNGDSCRIG